METISIFSGIDEKEKNVSRPQGLRDGIKALNKI